MPGISGQLPKLWSKELLPTSPATAVMRESVAKGSTLLSFDSKVSSLA